MAPTDTQHRTLSHETLTDYLYTRDGRIGLTLLPNRVLPALEAVFQGTQAALSDREYAEVMQMIQQQKPGWILAALLQAMLCQRAGRSEAARAYYETLVQVEPHPLILNELALIWQACGHPTRALAYRQQAHQLAPEDNQIEELLAKDLIMAGELEAGLKGLASLLEREAITESAYSDYLWYLHYQPGLSRAELSTVHRQWGERYAAPRSDLRRLPNVVDPNRKLRIGYLSGDFYSHVVAYLFDIILVGHDRNAFELYGYGNVRKPDEVTDYLAEKFDRYRPIYGLDDAQVAELIRQDQIDILVTLAGHTGEHRLTVLTHRVAPIQVESGGVDTTGMSQVDYRVTDTWVDPPETQVHYLEKLVFLKGGVLGYAPPQGAPPLGSLPALHKGYVTFGSFNNHLKINKEVVAYWAQVLRACPMSRMIVKFKAGEDPELRQRYLKQFADYGVTPERVDIIGWQSHGGHWDLYNEVDIGLDTFPFNGCITTFEALWMGVPVVTRVGTTFAGRMAYALLSAIGFDKFVAESAVQYVAKAAALAAYPEQLSILRATMRERLLTSPVCRPGRYAQELEQAYRMMWQEWCKKNSG